MKKHRLAGATAILLSLAGLASCDKNNPLAPNRNNPPEAGLKAAAFDITLLDHERGYNRDSVYCFEGIWKQDAFYFGYWKLDPMVPNIFPEDQNQLEFRISSEAAGFEGVNASSSSRCINIVQDGADHTRYHLEWVAEGESTITFWNGEGDARQEISFKATSKKHIPFETLKYRYDGELYTAKDLSSAAGYKTLLKPCPQGNTEWDNMPIYELVPEPLNATLEENTYLWGGLVVKLHRVTETGEEDRYTFDEDHPMWAFTNYPEGEWTERYKNRIQLTYKDICDRWPQTRLYSSFEDGKENVPLNFNDLRERRTVAYRVIHKKYIDDTASQEKQVVGGSLEIIKYNPNDPDDWKEIRILSGAID